MKLYALLPALGGIRRHPTAGLWGIEGIANGFSAHYFPINIRGLAVYVSLTDFHGEFEFVLRLVDPEDTPLSYGTFFLDFPDPNHVAEAVMPLPEITFLAPGVYNWELWVDDDLFEVRRFEVKRAPPAPR